MERQCLPLKEGLRAQVSPLAVRFPAALRTWCVAYRQTGLHQRILQIGTPGLLSSCLWSGGIISTQDRSSKYLEVKKQTNKKINGGSLSQTLKTTLCLWEDEACLGIFATPTFQECLRSWSQDGAGPWAGFANFLKPSAAPSPFTILLFLRVTVM